MSKAELHYHSFFQFESTERGAGALAGCTASVCVCVAHIRRARKMTRVIPIRSLLVSLERVEARQKKEQRGERGCHTTRSRADCERAAREM
jgi:hypothetical protein